nr:peptidase C48, SUMO/sentrin/Ubl1 [Tanacetum cinerariifolium]
MVKLKGKKKVKDDDEDFVVEEQHDEEDDNKNFESKFKSLRARTTVLPLYDATQSLSPERKSKIREMGFASMLDLPFQKIPGKLPYFVLKNLNTKKWKFHCQLIYLHYTKCNGMVTIPRKWPAIRNWTSKDATDRDIFEMCQGRFRLVDVIKENEETENESKVEKRKLKEANLNRDENKAGTSGARHRNDNDDVDYDGHCNDEDDVGHANHGDVHANGNDVVDFEEENEANEMGVDAKKLVKEDAKEKGANEATKKKEEAKKLAAEKKEKEKAKKLEAAKKKEAAEKSAKKAAEKTTKEAKEKAKKEGAEKAEREKIEATKKNKQAAQKEKKEKAEKEADEKKKAEMQKAAAEKKEQAEMQAPAEAKLKDKMQKDAEEKRQSPLKKKKKINPNRLLKKRLQQFQKVLKAQKCNKDVWKRARNDVVFDDGKGTIAHRKEMQSLAPDIEIEKQIIDTLVMVLNYEERIRTDGKDLRRRYFPTDTVYLQSKEEKEVKRKRKRKEKKYPGRWTRSDETKLLAKKHKRIKKKACRLSTNNKNKDKGKEEVVDVEQESEMNERLKKQKQAETEKRKIKNKGKEKVVDVEDEKCPMGDILITPKTVKEVLDLPMGRRKLEREGYREYNDPFLKEWKDQFNINKVTIKALSNLIIDTKMNILTLIANTLESCENNSSLKFTVLRNVFEGDDVSDIDWCSYILECASVSKVDSSKKRKKDVVYYGPVMFLMELYELIEESIKSILIDKSEIKEKIIENLIKFQNDERLIQLRDMMKVIFKEPNIPEYHSSSSTESDDDDDDKMKLITITKKNDQTDDVDWESVLENEEEIIRKGREYSAEQRKKDRQQEREQKRKGKKEKGSNRIIFSGQEEVFNHDERMILFRMNIQSLAPGLEIDTSVIDLYVSILNYEENFKMTNMKRHFFYTSMLVPGILEDKTKEIDKKIDAQYVRFHEMLSI